MQCIVPKRLTATVALPSPQDSCRGSRSGPPALRPPRCRRCSPGCRHHRAPRSPDATCAPSVTSKGTAVAVPPATTISCTTASAWAGTMSFTAMTRARLRKRQRDRTTDALPGARHEARRPSRSIVKLIARKASSAGNRRVRPMEVEGVRPAVPGVELLLRADHTYQVGGLPAFDQVLAVKVVHRTLQLEQELQAERDAPRQHGWITGAERKGGFGHRLDRLEQLSARHQSSGLDAGRRDRTLRSERIDRDALSFVLARGGHGQTVERGLRRPVHRAAVFGLERERRTGRELAAEARQIRRRSRRRLVVRSSSQLLVLTGGGTPRRVGRICWSAGVSPASKYGAMSACQRALTGSACIAATASASVPGVSK